jgi:hypothetical protein
MGQMMLDELLLNHHGPSKKLPFVFGLCSTQIRISKSRRSGRPALRIALFHTD